MSETPIETPEPQEDDVEKASIENGNVAYRGDSFDQTGDGNAGTGGTPVETIDADRFLGATSDVVHEDGWDESTHGQHPDTRLDSGI